MSDEYVIISDEPRAARKEYKDERINRNALKKLMPCCGNCANAKYMFWSGDADVQQQRFIVKLGRVNPADPDATKPIQVILRCAWLKQPVEKPNCVIECDGAKEID